MLLFLAKSFEMLKNTLNTGVLSISTFKACAEMNSTFYMFQYKLYPLYNTTDFPSTK